MPFPPTIGSGGGSRNPSVPAYINRSYWQGAVTFTPSSNLTGGSSVATTSRYGVISFWYSVGGGTASPSITHIRQVGTTISPHSFDPAGVFTMNAYISQTPPVVMSGTFLGLDLYSTTGATLFNGWVYTANTPPPGWHHVIWSWDAGQTNVCPDGSPVSGLPILRVQCAFDRGGTGWSPVVPVGGVYDTILGSNGIVADPFYGTSPQPMLATNGAPSFQGHTGVVASTAVFNEWQMSTDANSTTGLAYCYCGFSDAFFDLTNPENLNQFVTTTLTPVNLGLSGRNPTNQANEHPLTCLFMHTGNATRNRFLTPSNWNVTHDYKSSPDPSFTAWVTFPDNSQDFYFAIADSGPNLGGPVVPGDDFDVWVGPANSPYNAQFTINGANGSLWATTTGIITAPTQPPTGA